MAVSTSESQTPPNTLEVYSSSPRYWQKLNLQNPADAVGAPECAPSYNAKFGVFPHHDRLTGLTHFSSVPDYSHPPPLSADHINPFVSTPPQLTPGVFEPLYHRQEDYPSSFYETAGRDEHPHLYWLRNNLSVIQEVTGELTSSDILAAMQAGRERSAVIEQQSHNRAVQDQLDDHEDEWISTQPGPDSETEDEGQTPLKKAMKRLHTRASHTSNASNESARQFVNHSHFSSSHGIDVENSFAKVSHLGLHANITGTPGGTGMREVGSSMAGSSPLEARQYAPQHNHVQTRKQPYPRTTTQHVRDLKGVQALRSGHQVRSDRLSVGPQRYDERRVQNRKTPSRAQHTASMDRRSTAYQRELIDFTLVPRTQTAEPSMPRQPRVSGAVPLPEPGLRNAPRLHVSSSFPRLLRRYQTPSSCHTSTRNRKQRVSWLAFGICFLFPPLLVVFGFGFFDSLAALVTDGRIEHFGKKQKRLARWIGFSITIFAVFGLAIGLIVVRMVPNNLPRRE